jgi:TetR/AcrR family transcriptional regulator, regulator of autoinduction and epiphytic fitness
MGQGAKSATARVEQDPRVERSRRVILEAVLAELGDVGYGDMTIEGVAARAGVGKSTIYRHWPGKLELVEEAFTTLKAPLVIPDHGSIRDRVVSVLQQVASLATASTYSLCMPALIEAAERDTRVKAFHNRFTEERRVGFIRLLADAVEAGELEPGTDPALLADALVGPFLLRRLMLAEKIDDDLPARLVDQLLPIRRA